MANSNIRRHKHQLFGTRLLQTRRERNLTQMQLSEQLGSAGNSIKDYEAGYSMPNSDRLIELCVILGVSSDWLLGLD